MCGLAGVVTKQPEFRLIDMLDAASRVQQHRGPDMEGQYVHEEFSLTVGMCHQRLSIIDLTDSGKQPMWSKSKRSVISYNGEVYNYCELSEDYGSKSTTGSDTEVVLQVLEEKGIETALNLFNGMWAFAWLDLSSSKLYLARDRLGIKPLYYTIQEGELFFASEIKTILNMVGGQFSLNLQVAGDYLFKSLQDASNETLFNGIYSLPAGHYAEVDLTLGDVDLVINKYWDITYNPSNMTLSESVDFTKNTFKDSVALRMRSDVPVGVTLSGGIDSSAIASVMKSCLSSGQSLTALSVVSPGSKSDESEFIDEMADYLECDIQKVELEMKPEEAFALLRKVIWHNDAPAGSFSNVAHYLMMKKAKDLGITVILSGQGADELLCGYKKYVGFAFQELIRKGKYFAASKLLLGFLCNGSILNQFNFQEASRYLPSIFSSKKVNIAGPRLENYRPTELGFTAAQHLQERQVSDVKRFSIPFLTHYEDRMSMAWSREIRLPFLDYRLVEHFISLPAKFKIYKGWTKYVLRKATNDILPTKICWRKDKQGFGTPQESWLKCELKREVLKLLSTEALVFKSGLIDRDNMLQLYSDFCSQKEGKGGVWYRDVFNVVSFELWLEQNIKYVDFK